MLDSPTLLDLLTLIAAVFAIGISFYTLNFNRKIEHEIATQTLIHDQYELCRQLDLLRVDHPDVSHMLPLPSLTGKDPWEIYEQLRQHVRTVAANGGPVTDAMRSRLYLKEHAIALDVYNIYEQTLEQRDLAKIAGDQKRLKVLNALTDYYEKKMLRSPRMRYHWVNGASDMMESSTRQQYDKNVRDAYPNEKPDPRLPFDD